MGEGMRQGPAAEVARLSGREALERVLAGSLPAPPICVPMRFRLVEVGEGRAVFVGEPDGSHLNPLGTVHGGWALTLIDSAAGCAGHSLLAPGQSYATLETRANMTRPILPDAGPLRCEGRVISAGRRVITAEATLTDAAGRVMAHGGSTLLVSAAAQRHGDDTGRG